MENLYVAQIVGQLTLVTVGAKCMYDFTRFLYVNFLGRRFRRGIDVRTCGPWAVVTGATDGIGKAYVKQLSAHGLNIVLVSRTASKLQAVANELKSEYPSIKVKTIAMDFTDSSSRNYEEIKRELGQLQVGLLVNNVGTASGCGLLFNKMKEEDINDNVNCNMLSMAKMCHIVLPQMIERRKGVIINIGSVTAAAPTPLLALYGGTKAFVDKFSQDLAAEVKQHGVVVQTVNPGIFVATNMASHVKPSLINPDADTYVAATLSTLGLESRTAGYWVHRIQLWACDLTNYFLPRWILETLVYKHMEKEAEKFFATPAKQVEKSTTILKKQG